MRLRPILLPPLFRNAVAAQVVGMVQAIGQEGQIPLAISFVPVSLRC